VPGVTARATNATVSVLGLFDRHDPSCPNQPAAIPLGKPVQQGVPSLGLPSGQGTVRLRPVAKQVRRPETQHGVDDFTAAFGARTPEDQALGDPPILVFVDWESE